MGARCICQHAPDSADLETERRRRVERKGQPTEEVCIEKQLVPMPNNQKATAGRHTCGKEQRRIDTGLSRPSSKFSACLIVFSVGQIIKNAYITCASDQCEQGKGHYRPQRWKMNS